MKNYDVIIIGGGAAGFAAASFIESQKILLITGGRPLHKLSITGKGRCNALNEGDVDNVLKNIFTNAAFMRSSLTAFPPAAVMAWFESELGVPLKTERGGRVFPASDRAGDVVQALERSCGAEVVEKRVTSLILEDNRATGVKCGDTSFHAPRVVIATGGKSYPATGSTGDGYRLAEQAGHTIIPPKPALVPLETLEDCSGLAGLSLKNVRLSVAKEAGVSPAPRRSRSEAPFDRSEKFGEFGEMLFTHFGISGPLVLTASCCIREFPATLCIDLKPALDEKTLDARILREFAENKNKHLKNILPSLLPSTMVPEFIRRLGGLDAKSACEITREERRRLVTLFKAFELTVTGTRPIDEAVITDGGVCVREVNPKTMESKLVQGLYFAGEVLDVAAFTGGFNLQIAWSTAFAAARGIKDKIGE